MGIGTVVFAVDPPRIVTPPPTRYPWLRVIWVSRFSTQKIPPPYPVKRLHKQISILDLTFSAKNLIFTRNAFKHFNIPKVSCRGGPANTTVCKYKRIRTRTPRYGPEDIAVAQSLAIISKARVQVQGTGTRRDKSSRCLYLGTSVETHKNDYEKWCRRAGRGYFCACEYS